MRREKAALKALIVLEEVVTRFPGLVDGETEVTGTDLVELLSFAIKENEELDMYLSVFTIDSEITKE